MKRIAAFAAVVIALSGAAHAGAPKAGLFQPGEKDVLIYDAACSDNPVECALAGLFCASGEFQIAVATDNKHLAQWLSGKNGLDGMRVAGIDGLGELTAEKVERNELSGGWDVTFRASGKPAGITAGASSIEIGAPVPVTLRLDAAATGYVSSLITSCQ